MTFKLSLTRKGKKDLKAQQLPMSSSVKIGVLSGSALHTGSQSATIAEVAWFNEFGTRSIPERPFMRTTWANKIEWIKSVVEEGSKKALLSDTPRSHMNKVMDFIGQRFSADLKNAIEGWTTPPNALYTQIRKGEKKHLPPGTLVDNPLKDIGEMQNSITHVVERER